MRLIGIIMIVVGLFYAVAKPWFGSNFTGKEIARSTVFDKSKSNSEDRGWRVGEISLPGDSDKVRIRINVLRLPGQIYDNGRLSLIVRLARAGQVGSTQTPLMSEEVSVSLENTGSGTDASKPYLIFATSSEFTVPRAGQYKIGAIPKLDGTSTGNISDIDANIIGIEAQVLSGVQTTGTSNTLFGGALVIFGIVLMSIAKRRKQRGNTNVASAPPKTVATADPADNINPAIGRKEPPPPPVPKAKPKPDPETDVGKTIKWGRDAGKKR